MAAGLTSWPRVSLARSAAAAAFATTLFAQRPGSHGRTSNTMLAFCPAGLLMGGRGPRAGLRVQTAIGLATVTYALSPDLSVGQGKVHVGLAVGL